MCATKSKAMIEVGKLIKEIEDYIEKRKEEIDISDHDDYSNLRYAVDNMLLDVKAYANEHEVPLFLHVEDMLENLGVDEPYYEEESSSYYEEYEESEYSDEDDR